MEQIENLFELLKETPEMALWGITIYLTYVLLKLASWVYALKSVLQLAIRKYFSMKDKQQTTDIEKSKIENDIKKKELELSVANDILKHFKSSCISNIHKQDLLMLINEIKTSDYIHTIDIKKAIKLIKESKEQR